MTVARSVARYTARQPCIVLGYGASSFSPVCVHTAHRSSPSIHSMPCLAPGPCDGSWQNAPKDNGNVDAAARLAASGNEPGTSVAGAFMCTESCCMDPLCRTAWSAVSLPSEKHISSAHLRRASSHQPCSLLQLHRLRGGAGDKDDGARAGPGDCGGILTGQPQDISHRA